VNVHIKDAGVSGLFKETPLFLSESGGEVGYPSRVSRKGKAGPLEAGRGKYSPPANPERVTLEPLKRRKETPVRMLELPELLRTPFLQNAVRRREA